MKIHIHGTAPNTAIRIEAETEAENDQIARLRREAETYRVLLCPLGFDRKHILRMRVENKAALEREPVTGDRCKHGTLVDHCPECAPEWNAVVANEKAQAERRSGATGGTY